MRPHFTTIPAAVALAALSATLSVPSRAFAQNDALPASPSAPQVVKHTVKKGDTLWDIAKFYLKDPFRWPQVFHANTDIIKNPHWIYPGQVLTIEGDAVREDVAARVDSSGFVAPQPSPRPAGATVFMTSAPAPILRRTAVLEKPPAYTVREGEYEAAPWVVDSRTPFAHGKILGAAEHVAVGLSSTAGYKLYDRLYVSVPSPVQPGDEIVLARRGETIPDVGDVIEPTAILRVDSLAKAGTVLGTIVRQFQAVHDGELTASYDRTFVPTTVRPVPGTYALSTTVLWLPANPVLPTLQSYIIVHATTGQGVRTGDRFTLYDTPLKTARGTMAPNATATVQIVRVTPYAATGIVIDQVQPTIVEGMASRLTAKMP